MEEAAWRRKWSRGVEEEGLRRGGGRAVAGAGRTGGGDGSRRAGHVQKKDGRDTEGLFRLGTKIFWVSHRMCRKDVGRVFKN